MGDNMLYVDKDNLEIPPDWENRAVIKITNLRAKTDKTNLTYSGAFWGELRAIFAAVYGEQCWYCENKISGSTPEIEHFRPKSKVTECNTHPGYWWLAYTFSNYRFSCSICNNQAHKGNKFPLVDEDQRANTETCDLTLEEPQLLDPYSKEDCNSLRCNTYEYKMDAVAPHKYRAEKTIEVFGLDRDPHIRDCGYVIKTLKGFLDQLDGESQKIAIQGYIKNSKPGFSSFIKAFLDDNNVGLEN